MTTKREREQLCEKQACLDDDLCDGGVSRLGAAVQQVLLDSTSDFKLPQESSGQESAFACRLPHRWGPKQVSVRPDDAVLKLDSVRMCRADSRVPQQAPNQSCVVHKNDIWLS